MAHPGTAHEGVKRELAAERASALARAGERLEAALRELSEAEAALGALPSARARALRDEALAHAAERLWYLVIHREALGLRDHRILDEVWRIPAAVHAAMGPRRGGSPGAVG